MDIREVAVASSTARAFVLSFTVVLRTCCHFHGDRVRDGPTIGLTGALEQWAAHDAEMTRYDAGPSACMLKPRTARGSKRTHPWTYPPTFISIAGPFGANRVSCCEMACA